VEIFQLFTLDRTTSPTDLVSNTVGAFLGAIAAIFTLKLISKALASRSLQKHIQIKFFFPLLVACFIVAAGSLHPFDFTLAVGSLLSKIKFLANQPIHFKAALSDEGIVFIRFFLFAFVCSLCFREWQHPNSAIKGIIFSSLIGLAFESCQIIIESRMPSFQDGAVVVLGSIGGGLFAAFRRRLNSPQIWSIMMIAATWMAAMLHTLSPFRFTSDYHSLNWFPFLAYYDRTSFVALSNFIESVLIYYPLGFVLAYFIDREKSPYIFIGIITGVIAFPLELSQGWVDGRYPDITDVLGAVMGAIFGAWTCREGWKAFERYVLYMREIEK
jgi:glycopeptide antibiotics resistance protein